MKNNVPTGIAYSDAQKQVAFQKKQKEIDRLWRELREASEDAYHYLHKLMFELYEVDKAGRSMTMGQACAAIPARHASTCKKYIEYAKSEKLVTYRRHPVDKRKVLIVPTTKLIELVENEILNECREIDEISRDFNRTPPEMGPIVVSA